MSRSTRNGGAPPALDRTPPHSLDGEQCVLGAMLQFEDATPKVIPLLRDHDFYVERHRMIYRALEALFSRGTAIDPITVSEELRVTGMLEHVGGQVYLAELLDIVPTAANVTYHAGIVAEEATLRRLIETSTLTVQEAYDRGGRQVREIVDRAHQRLMEASSGHGGAKAELVKRSLMPVFEDIERRQDAAEAGRITGLSTGLKDLDELTGGMQDGEMWVIAARPSMGKTALGVQIALHVALSGQKPAAIFSLEMSTNQLVQRMLCQEALVDLSRLLRGRLSDNDFPRLAQAAGHLNVAPLWIVEASGMSVLDLRARARETAAEAGELALIVVDYIQLMEAGGHENRQQEVSAISRGLKALAVELHCPVLALSQLSRAPESRSNHRPMLSDLRESGSLEQDADVVVFPYRPEYYLTRAQVKEKNLEGHAELIVGKHRNGPTGDVAAYFRKECTRFEMSTRAVQMDLEEEESEGRRERRGGRAQRARKDIDG